MKHIVGFSGGIDSQATAIVVLGRYQSNDVLIVNSDAGGNEHPLTVEHVAWFSENIHPVVPIRAIVADMWVGQDMPAKHGYDPNEPLTFDLMAKIKGRFPSRMMQFCTEKLKLAPLRRWIRENVEGEYERWSGVRRDESASRKDTPFRCRDDYFNCFVNHPIADWTKQQSFDCVRKAGQKINPLYTLGFNRVGCAPCINSGKDDILAWHQRFPEMIDKIRSWEALVGTTFFAPIVPGQTIAAIDDVIAWAKTSRGGRQPNLFKVLNDRPACESAYGLCE